MSQPKKEDARSMKVSAFSLVFNKLGIYVIVALLVVIGAASVVLIQSSTAYEYSYHGKLLGTARSVDDVYKTIDALGDKLSKATGANVSLDVERDMEFHKVVGFNLDVDSDEDILNTITYMKDLQVEAYVICLDDEETCLLESEAAAKAILNEIQTEYTTTENGAQINGAKYAKYGSKPEEKQITPDEELLLLPWTSEEKAICGGALWISKSYIEKGQDTLYFQKFDILDNEDGLYEHQYAQNIAMANNEGIRYYSAYASQDMLDSSFVFIIPVYEQMPTEYGKSPQ